MDAEHGGRAGTTTVLFVQGYVAPFARKDASPGRLHVYAPLPSEHMGVFLRDLQLESAMERGGLREYCPDARSVLWDVYGTDFPSVAFAAASLALAPTPTPAWVTFTLACPAGEHDER